MPLPPVFSQTPPSFIHASTEPPQLNLAEKKFRKAKALDDPQQKTRYVDELMSQSIGWTRGGVISLRSRPSCIIQIIHSIHIVHIVHSIHFSHNSFTT